jgi:hypothetical protein
LTVSLGGVAHSATIWTEISAPSIATVSQPLLLLRVCLPAGLFVWVSRTDRTHEAKPSSDLTRTLSLSLFPPLSLSLSLSSLLSRCAVVWCGSGPTHTHTHTHDEGREGGGPEWGRPPPGLLHTCLGPTCLPFAYLPWFSLSLSPQDTDGVRGWARYWSSMHRTCSLHSLLSHNDHFCPCTTIIADHIDRFGLHPCHSPYVCCLSTVSLSLCFIRGTSGHAHSPQCTGLVWAGW